MGAFSNIIARRHAAAHPVASRNNVSAGASNPSSSSSPSDSPATSYREAKLPSCCGPARSLRQSSPCQVSHNSPASTLENVSITRDDHGNLKITAETNDPRIIPSVCWEKTQTRPGRLGLVTRQRKTQCAFRGKTPEGRSYRGVLDTDVDEQGKVNITLRDPKATTLTVRLGNETITLSASQLRNLANGGKLVIPNSPDTAQNSTSVEPTNGVAPAIETTRAASTSSPKEQTSQAIDQAVLPKPATVPVSEPPVAAEQEPESNAQSVTAEPKPEEQDRISGSNTANTTDPSAMNPAESPAPETNAPEPVSPPAEIEQPVSAPEQPVALESETHIPEPFPEPKTPESTFQPERLTPPSEVEPQPAAKQDTATMPPVQPDVRGRVREQAEQYIRGQIHSRIPFAPFGF